MAKRRMFSEDIVGSDAFLDMPLSTQALYFHIGMKADDDGICANAKTLMRMVGANQNDMDLLVAKGFCLQCERGIIVVKHWKINNYIQNDRYHKSEYPEIKEKLFVKENRSYTLDPSQGTPLIPLDTKCIQNGYRDKISLDKTSLDKSSIDENGKSEGKGKTSAEVMEEIKRKREEQNELF